MNKYIKLSIIFIPFSVTFLLFQNCNKVKLTDINSEELNSPANTLFVQNSCSGSARQITSKTLFFPKPPITCEWEINGNLAPRDQYFQGRIEEELKLSLPEGSILCDIKFNFVEQKFLYDDHFIITFNDAIIASSYNFDNVLSKKNELLRYDWTKIAGMFWDHKKEGVICAPNSSCAWPKTVTLGVITLAYPSFVFQKIMAEDINRIEHSLKFISIGDNDNQDCEHSDINFNLDIEYVTKK